MLSIIPRWVALCNADDKFDAYLQYFASLFSVLSTKDGRRVLCDAATAIGSKNSSWQQLTAILDDV